jgi:site-specific recombinase XerD
MINLSGKYLGELVQDGKAEKTIISYRTTLKQFVNWFEETNGYTDIDKVTPMDIKDFKQYMITVKDRKPATVNKALVTIKGFFEWTTENSLTRTNPARKIKLVEKQNLAPKWLERNEQNKLLREIEKEKNAFKLVRDLAIAQMMMQAGCRVEEVANLELRDIEVNCRSGNVIIRHGKRDKYREVPLNKDAREAIKDYLKVRENHKYKDSQFLFVSERSPKMTVRAIQHLIEKYGESAKIEGLTSHILRHTFCHNLIAAKEGIEKVAILAGHSSLESTRIYTVPGKKELQDAVEKIGISEN